MNKLFFFPLAIAIALVLTPLANAVGTLHFKPENHFVVSANHFVTVNGTSAPSNATRTKCNVMFQTNGNGYMPVTPQGPKGPGDYTKWSTTSSQMMKLGINSLEGQIECFPPGATNLTAVAPNYIHHLNHNVTGV